MTNNEEIINENQQASADEPITVVLDEPSLKQQLDQEKSLNNQLKGDLRRLKAEFENYRRRSDMQSKNALSTGNFEVIEKLLPLMDAFENAQNIIKDKSVLQGVTLIGRQLQELLGQYSVQKIDALGKDFDPQFHNAIMTKPDPENSGKIVEVIKTGYTAGEKVLRYAYVVVAQ